MAPLDLPPNLTIPIAIIAVFLIENCRIHEKSVGTTELHYSTKKQENFQFTFRLLSDISYCDECQTKIAFSML